MAEFFSDTEDTRVQTLTISASLLVCAFAAPQGSFEDEGQVVGAGSPNVRYSYYLHNTPDEEEIGRVVPKFITPPNLKRNKVIFVKVPPAPPKQQGPIDLPARIIDKTIVYVLVKKEKDPEIIKITTETPKAPEPPIVHVVKYDDDKDIENKIVKGVSSSKLYGKTPYTEDQVNIQLERVKGVTELKFISSSGSGSSASFAAGSYAGESPPVRIPLGGTSASENSQAYDQPIDDGQNSGNEDEDYE